VRKLSVGLGSDHPQLMAILPITHDVGEIQKFVSERTVPRGRKIPANLQSFSSTIHGPNSRNGDAGSEDRQDVKRNRLTLSTYARLGQAPVLSCRPCRHVVKNTVVAVVRYGTRGLVTTYLFFGLHCQNTFAARRWLRKSINGGVYYSRRNYRVDNHGLRVRSDLVVHIAGPID